MAQKPGILLVAAPFMVAAALKKLREELAPDTDFPESQDTRLKINFVESGMLSRHTKWLSKEMDKEDD